MNLSIHVMRLFRAIQAELHIRIARLWQFQGHLLLPDMMGCKRNNGPYLRHGAVDRESQLVMRGRDFFIFHPQLHLPLLIGLPGGDHPELCVGRGGLLLCIYCHVGERYHDEDQRAKQKEHVVKLKAQARDHLGFSGPFVPHVQYPERACAGDDSEKDTPGGST